jgi:hypothetical protein
MGGGGAHSAPFGLLMSPKDGCAQRTGAHARLELTRTLYQSKKNVRNEMKKIRQTNFYTLQRGTIPKCNDCSVGTLTLHSELCIKILFLPCAASVFPRCNGISPTLLCLLTQPVGMASKSNTAAKYVYAPLVMVSLGAW